MAPASPTLAAWELGVRLREVRERMGLTPQEGASAVGMVKSALNNVEHGRRNLAGDKFGAVCSAYRLTSEEADELRALQESSFGRGWWWHYGGLFPAELLRFFGFEDGAEQIETFESNLVSGLLQTESYARAIHRGDAANVRLSDVERSIEVRMRRQERITGTDPIRAVVVMGESALWQQIGGAAVLADQLQHLLGLVAKYPDTLDLRIVPFTSGGCGAMGGSTFHLLTFPSPRLPKLAWQETAVTTELVHDELRLREYRASFAEVLDHAANADESVKLIRNALTAIS